jgi:hypothetical protein
MAILVIAIVAPCAIIFSFPLMDIPGVLVVVPGRLVVD